MHSTTYRRQAKRIEALQAFEQRAKDLITWRDHYTDEDRKVAEELESRELMRALMAEDL